VARNWTLVVPALCWTGGSTDFTTPELTVSWTEATALKLHLPSECVSKTIRHGPRVVGVQVDVLGADDVLDGTEHAGPAVVGADDGVLLDVRAYDKC
jgi:hypothetical protein